MVGGQEGGEEGPARRGLTWWGNRRVSSWVPKEEKLSWRTGAPPRASPPPPPPSFSLFLSLSSAALLAEGETGNSFDAQAKKTEGGAREFVRPSGRFLVSFICRFVGENAVLKHIRGIVFEFYA